MKPSKIIDNYDSKCLTRSEAIQEIHRYVLELANCPEIQKAVDEVDKTMNKITEKLYGS